MKKFMKITLVTLILSLFTLSLQAAPGSGHSHKPISQEKAIIKAKSMLDGLIRKGTIPLSWKNKEVLNIKKQKFGNILEWVVSFKNEELEDKSKEILYIFINLQGKITAANYTGK